MIRQEVAAACFRSRPPPLARPSQNGFPSIRRLGFLPRSALADRLEHARPRRPRRPTSALHRTPGPQIPIGPAPSPSLSRRPAVSPLGGFPTPALQPSPQLLCRAAVQTLNETSRPLRADTVL